MEALLREMEDYAQENHVPIINEGARDAFCRIICEERPHRVLELGTAIGYSALLMAGMGAEDIEVVSLELNEARAAKAKEFIRRSPYKDRIQVLSGDAADLLGSLHGPFDFVFMDAAKGQYINFWPEVKRLTRDGGVIVTDNVLQDGDIIESRFAITRRNRTIHKRMRDYLYELTHDEGFSTTILPLGDGVSISVKGKL